MYNIRKLYFKDTSFANLMQHRIYNVLLISSKYDAFILEEDGRIDEQLFNEYVALNLRYAPRFTLVESEAEAQSRLDAGKYELLIAMSDSAGNDIIGIAQRIKQRHRDIPVVVLTPFLREVSMRLRKGNIDYIDYVFSWLGNSDLLLAIIKLLEDRMNVREDVASVGVQILLFVEDSVRCASSILPHLYKFVFNQSRSFMTEALNEHQQMLRMRGRPKILMARTYEEALEIFDRYSDNIMGIVSDVSFPRSGKMSRHAGIDLCRHVKSIDPFMSYILESSEEENIPLARELGVPFIDKNDEKTLPGKLKKLLLEDFGFGNFIFRNPDTGEKIAEASDLKELQRLVLELPDESLRRHFSRNDVSKWLYSRAMFPLASFVEALSVDDFGNLSEVKQALFDAIVRYRKIKNRGIVAVFRKDRFDRYSNFARIGSGSMGGKGRGLAFLDSTIKNYPELDDFENERNVQITIPKTVVLCTDIFDEFMDANNLYPVALSGAPDEVILRHFLDASLPDYLPDYFTTFFEAIAAPVAVRSSSLLEDSYYQPFAGVYSTCMIPFSPDTPKQRFLDDLSAGVKAVYASVFYRESRAYMASTVNVIDSEKMAVVLQEIVGRERNGRYYPSFSGVARSVNFYPVEPERPDDGVCNVALGLGKYVVDGGVSLRFSPARPDCALQTNDVKTALRETQTRFLALNTSATATFELSADDRRNLSEFTLKHAEEDGTLRLIASTFDRNDHRLRDGLFEGRKVITFANILKHDAFPLAAILRKVLKICRNDMGYPVEIEFAVNLAASPDELSSFNLLQIRPIVANDEILVENLASIDREQTFVFSTRALGNGIIDDLSDFVYVKPQSFDPLQSETIAEELDKLNAHFLAEGRNYILSGPGRWGSSDPALGIPVKWAQISAARLIIEAGLENYRVEPSQGTHFFHNITSFKVGYFTVDPHTAGEQFDEAYLSRCPVAFESRFIRHIRLPQPATVKIDGRTGRGAVFKV
ncbi:MAG: phosphoenolpyruvate synthase [Prevotellaceae bacterium]|jgi:CheY-like chemotaxis protein|nr:phosphoenolpyruvate synthase [Prevotellaceae bacterium]